MRRKKKQGHLRVRAGFWVYLLLLCYATVLTQLLRNPVSAVLFWFLLIVGPLSLLLVVIGRGVIQVYVSSETERTEKMIPVEYEIRIINQSPIPYPFVEAAVTQPQDNGVRSNEETLVLSLIPFGGYAVKKQVHFRYRGLYEIGVKEFYVGDFLGMWRLRVDINNYSNVTVYPRKMDLENMPLSAISDVPTQSVRAANTNDMSEISNIREYRFGDTLKSVHWKMSSKFEELQVKDYNTNDDRHVYVFVDLAAPTPSPTAEKQKAVRKLRRILRDRDREERRQAIGKIAGETEKIGKSIFQKIKSAREKAEARRKKNKYRRRRVAGNSAASIETMDMIDALIRETSGGKKTEKQKQKENKRAQKLGESAEEAARIAEEKTARDEIISKLSETIDGNISNAQKESISEEQRKWGGAVKAEFEDEMPEYCADGVIEIAVAVMLEELRRGSKCTVAWFDSREDSGVCVCNMTGISEFDAAYASFSGAHVASYDKRVASFAEIIGEAVNVTVKIVTANIDPQSMNDYAAIPSMFGGAGTGCVTEILLFDPEDKYTDPEERAQYAFSCTARMRQCGITVTNIKETAGSDGKAILVNADLL